MRYFLCDSLGPGDHGRVFFSVRSISKVINRKQNGHIAPHGLLGAGNKNYVKNKSKAISRSFE